MGGRSRLPAALSSLIAVLAAAEVLRLAASFARAPLAFDVGPSTGVYLDGFTESEERLPVTFRWTREKATVAPPLVGTAEEATLSIRYARFLEGNASVRLFLDGEPAGSLTARSGRFRTQELTVALPSVPVRLELLVDDPDPERLGIAVDWIRIENARFRLPWTSWRSRIFLAGLFALALGLGFSVGSSTLLTGLAAFAQALWFAKSPFVMAHVHEQIAVPVLASSAAVAALFWRHRTTIARFVPLLYLVGYVLKGAALFHPSYFYPDVRLHRRHLEAFNAAEGNFVERGIAAQKVAETAYPRKIAGKDYAFPYSPVFYIPFTILERDARGIEASMKHVGLVLAALELPLVFLLARSLLGADVALWASILTLFLPPMLSRLLYAQWPTMAGHLFDLVAIFFAARMLSTPSALRPLLLYGASGLVSCLLYVTSLINLSLFSGFLALFERERRSRVLFLWALIASGVVLLLYFPFVVAFFTEILPALSRGGSETVENPAAGVGGSLFRLYLFLGIGFPALSLVGFLLVLGEREKWVGRILAVYAASFVALLALRAGSGMFKDLKEFVFIGPFVAITTGASLDSLWRRGAYGRVAAVLVAIGLAAFGLSKYGEYLGMHTRLAGLGLSVAAD